MDVLCFALKRFVLDIPQNGKNSKQRGVNMKKLAIFGGIAATFFSTSAHAAIDLLGFSVDVGPIETLAGIMLTALAVIWVSRRVLSFMGR